MKVKDRQEPVQMLRLCFICVRPGNRSKGCKIRICCVPNFGQQHNDFLNCGFSKKEAARVTSDAKRTEAEIINQGGLLVVRIRIVKKIHSRSVLAIFDTRSSISIVDKSIIYALHLQESTDHKKMSRRK